jgi:galactose-1-phosphate uridylyltransferase
VAQPFPYILAFHQAPTDGMEHPEAHLHAEFYPAYRMPGRLKYLAGSEIGAGVFTADTEGGGTARCRGRSRCLRFTPTRRAESI